MNEESRPLVLKRRLFDYIGWLILLLIGVCLGLIFSYIEGAWPLGLLILTFCFVSLFYLRSRTLLVVSEKGIRPLHHPLNRKLIPWSNIGNLEATTRNHLVELPFYIINSTPYPYLRIRLHEGKDVLVPVKQYLEPDGVFFSPRLNSSGTGFENLIAEIEKFRLMS